MSDDKDAEIASLKAELLTTRELLWEMQNHLELYVEITSYIAGGEGMPEKWAKGAWFTEPLPKLNELRRRSAELPEDRK